MELFKRFAEDLGIDKFIDEYTPSGFKGQNFQLNCYVESTNPEIIDGFLEFNIYDNIDFIIPIYFDYSKHSECVKINDAVYDDDIFTKVVCLDIYEIEEFNFESIPPIELLDLLNVSYIAVRRNPVYRDLIDLVFTKNNDETIAKGYAIGENDEEDVYYLINNL